MVHLSTQRLQLLWWALVLNEFQGTVCQVTTKPNPYPVPDIEKAHSPEMGYELERGRGMAPKNETPDFRIEEDTWNVYSKHVQHFFEFNRPYRISPHAKQTAKFKTTKEHPANLGCYCTTVYKRLTLLAGCAVITTRHILTTASSTEMVLSRYRDNKELTNILGAWYDDNGDTLNSSNYMTPARIHYHPQRAYMPSTPRHGDIALIVGFQFVKAFRKVPAPWFKYVVRADSFLQCPKADWGWMHCIQGSTWGRYGIDSGAAWHRALPNKAWIHDGLIGMGAFSMRLRSEQLVHYFTVINSHPVLDFLYAAYTGRQPFEFLDWRFYNTQWRSPVQKPWAWIDRTYPEAEIHKYYEELPAYK